MNSITFDGRLVADSEIRKTPGGDSVLSFRVASDIGFGDKKTTNWFSCQLWGKRGESLQQYLTKGQQVTVYGQLTLREWNDKEGIKRLSPDIRVNELTLQGGKQEGAPATGNTQSAPPQRQQQEAGKAPTDNFEEDIPF